MNNRVVRVAVLVLDPLDARVGFCRPVRKSIARLLVGLSRMPYHPATDGTRHQEGKGEWAIKERTKKRKKEKTRRDDERISTSSYRSSFLFQRFSWREIGAQQN
jgi:hypothetical protein